MNVTPPVLNPSDVLAASCKQIEADRAVITAALALRDSLQAELPDLKAQLAALLESGADDDAAVAELSRLRTKVELAERKLQKVLAELAEASKALADLVYRFVQQCMEYRATIEKRVEEKLRAVFAEARAPFEPELRRLTDLEFALRNANYRAEGDRDAWHNSSRAVAAWSDFVKAGAQ